VDVGDIIGVKGFVFTARKTGEISIPQNSFTFIIKISFASSCSKETTDESGNMKFDHDAFTDPEQRYRQRYVDLGGESM